MKRISLILIAMLLLTSVALASTPSPNPAGEMAVTDVLPGNAYIPKGTMLQGELITAVSSGKNKAGDKISFKVLEDVTIGDVVVIPKGTVGEGFVKSAKKAGLFGKGGSIQLDASVIQSSNGIEVPLTMDMSKVGGDRRVELNYNNSVESAVISGLVPGKNQKIAAGTKLIIFVPLNVDLDIKSEDLSESIGVPNSSAARLFMQPAPTTTSPFVVGNEWIYSGDKGTIRFTITQVGKKVKGNLSSTGPALLTFDQLCEADVAGLSTTLKAKDKTSRKKFVIQLYFRTDGTVQYIIPTSSKGDKESIILQKVTTKI